MKKRTVILFSVVFLCMILCLAGCGGKQDLQKEDAEVLEQGVLRVGINLHTEPVAYVDSDTSKPAGFEVEVAQKIAEKLGMELEIVDTTEGNLLNSLDADLYDCVISAVGISEWNQKEYEATEPYADYSSVEDTVGRQWEYPQAAVFCKKGNPLAVLIQEDALESLKKDGTLTEISRKYFETDIILE